MSSEVSKPTRTSNNGMNAAYQDQQLKKRFRYTCKLTCIHLYKRRCIEIVYLCVFLFIHTYVYINRINMYRYLYKYVYMKHANMHTNVRKYIKILYCSYIIMTTINETFSYPNYYPLQVTLFTA